MLLKFFVLHFLLAQLCISEAILILIVVILFFTSVMSYPYWVASLLLLKGLVFLQTSSYALDRSLNF